MPRLQASLSLAVRLPELPRASHLTYMQGVVIAEEDIPAVDSGLQLSTSQLDSVWHILWSRCSHKKGDLVASATNALMTVTSSWNQCGAVFTPSSPLAT